MSKKVIKKKEGKDQLKTNEKEDKEDKLSEEELESISGGIAPIMWGNKNP